MLNIQIWIHKIQNNILKYRISDLQHSVSINHTHIGQIVMERNEIGLKHP